MSLNDGMGPPTAPSKPDNSGSRSQQAMSFGASPRGFAAEPPPVRRSSAAMSDGLDPAAETKVATRSRNSRGYGAPEDSLRRGRPRFCPHCGGVMAKSSRMVLSAASAFLLVVFGAGLVAAYGFATNFLQTPWYIKFTLPAMYYVGSLFVGVGILLFFIREKIWRCEHCREVRKR